MEWEEHDLEYQMASLGLDMDYLFMAEREGDDDKDWLEVWMGSLTARWKEALRCTGTWWWRTIRWR